MAVFWKAQWITPSFNLPRVLSQLSYIITTEKLNMTSFPDNGNYGLGAQIPVTGIRKLDWLATPGATNVQAHYSKM